jgi:hypothetical protein
MEAEAVPPEPAPSALVVVGAGWTPSAEKGDNPHVRGATITLPITEPGQFQYQVTTPDGTVARVLVKVSTDPYPGPITFAA